MRDDIIKERAELLKAAQTIIKTAKDAGRDLTDAEVTDLEAKGARIDEIDKLIAATEKAQAVIRGIGALADSETLSPVGDKPAGKSLGEHFVAQVAKAGLKGRTVAAPEWLAKDADTTHATGGLEGVYGPILTTVDRSVVQAYRRPTVTNLLGAGTISGQAITYFVEGPREGNFTTVAEAGAKPQFHYADPTTVTDALSELAGFIRISDIMAEDLDFVVSEINARLLYDLQLVEETQLMNGDGAGTNIKGLLNRSGLQVATAKTVDLADEIYKASMAVQIQTGMSADGILIHPADYQKIRLSKDANGQYFGGGIFFSAYTGELGVQWQPPLWGMRTVVSPAIAQGTVLVGAFAQAATVYRKGGVRVESTNSDADNFTTDKITIRAKERLALAVRQPAAFVKITATA